MASRKRDFLDLSDFSGPELRGILDAGKAIKSRRRTPRDLEDKPLAGKKIAMIFEQPSLRTRMSFDVGIRELGGETLMVSSQEIEIGKRESIADSARVLSRFVDGIMIRMLNHENLRELAENATVPVINGLSKTSHPCQVMADLLTFEEHQGPITGRTVSWVGDANNVLASWMHAAARFRFTINIATPDILQPDEKLIAWTRAAGGTVKLMRDPHEAAQGSDCIITDCWVSMGDKDVYRRHNLLRPYQVDGHLMRSANKGAIFMHCLPAKRGEEVSEEVIDGPQSVVFDEAENRLHAQKGVLAYVFGAVNA
jgi:ornithine carbamoyltransferase